MNKISTKLILAVCLIVISIIVIFSYFIIESEREAMIRILKHHANRCSDIVKRATEYDMLLNQPDRIYRIIESIGADEAIEKIRIFNKAGNIIYSTERSELGTMVDKKAESCFACHNEDAPLERLPIPERARIFTTSEGKKMLSIINPIYNEPKCWQADCHVHDQHRTVLGVLDVTVKMQDIEDQLAASRSKVIFLTLSSIVAISVLLWILVRVLVGKPVEELVEATKKVAEGRINYKINKFRNDELGMLERSFNEMTSKLEEVQRQLYQSDKLASLGRLTSGIAHEINNPLTGVLSYASILLKRKDLKPEVKQDLEVIIRESKRCREIVKGLLNFARQEPLKKTKLNMNEVIARTISILSNQLSLNHVTVHIESAGDLCEIYADANQMQQVLMNLMLNAIDAFGQKGGKIEIETKCETMENRKGISILISDNGCGIPEESLSKIFDPFFTTKGQKGTGLGLAVVWGIVERHQGKIFVDSEVGKGTTFKLWFPANDSVNPLIKESRNEQSI